MLFRSNFVINGSPIYNANTFILSAQTPNQISYFGVYRLGANAYIRWNEPWRVWETYNVDNSNYYRILTDEYLNDTTTNTSPTLVATANAVYKVSLNTASAAAYANGSFVQANAAFLHANAAFAAANNVAPQIQPAFDRANVAFIQANAAFNKANTVISTVSGTTGSKIGRAHV